MPTITAAMTPSPPELSTRVDAWSSEELFYLVTHGVKFTGMPAWPAPQRDDEVWAVVAFLRTMPQLDGAAYRQLVHGDGPTGLAPTSPTFGTDVDRPPSSVVATCARCHGLDGSGRGVGAFPRLGGQRRQYLENSLRAYASGERFSGIMGPIAAALSPATIAELSSYYSRQTSGGDRLDGMALQARGEPSDVARGEEIARRGIPRQDVPACRSCHGPSSTPRNPAYPVLAGQHAGYLTQQLALLQGRRRGGSA